jgi:ABC-2 type transport system permease protein
MSAVEPGTSNAPKPADVLSARAVSVPNWLGLWTLYRRQLTAFLRFGLESIGGPLVSSLLFLAVFVLALAGRQEMLPGIGVAQFVAPGLVAFALTHSAFDMGAFPVLHDKLEGMIQDITMAPLSPLELLAGYVLAAATAGLINAAVILAAVSVFVPLPMVAVGQALGFALLLAALFALLGMLVGLWANKWDHYSAAETFLVMPLGLLSGSFFSIQMLPEAGQAILRANPVFYGIDGFRAGILGHAESQPWLGVALLLAVELALVVFLWCLVARGYKIRT